MRLDHGSVRRAALCLDRRAAKGSSREALRGLVAAVSVGMVRGAAHLDLAYDEDSAAEVDMNVAKTDDGRYIEIREPPSATLPAGDRHGASISPMAASTRFSRPSAPSSAIGSPSLGRRSTNPRTARHSTRRDELTTGWAAPIPT